MIIDSVRTLAVFSTLQTLTGTVLVEAEDFDPSYRDASFFGSTAGSFMKHAPWVNNLMQALPMWAAASLHPAMASFMAQKRVLYHLSSTYKIS